jgi:hypothetical protein
MIIGQQLGFRTKPESSVQPGSQNKYVNVWVRRQTCGDIRYGWPITANDEIELLSEIGCQHLLVPDDAFTEFPRLIMMN